MAFTNYTSFITILANELVVPVADSNYVTQLPQIIDGAEQRCYRELDLLNTIVTDATASLSTGTRAFNLPSSNGTFVVVENINVITPSGQTPNLGTRNTLVPVSRDVINFLYPSSSGSTVPTYFAMLTQTTILVAPWPDAAYTVEVVGTIRPTPLAASNATTLLTQYFPDLFFAAAMVEGAAYLKNFGAAADDPRMSMTWEKHYQDLMQSAAIEEARKKFTMAGWSSKQPSSQATPPRT